MKETRSTVGTSNLFPSNKDRDSVNRLTLYLSVVEFACHRVTTLFQFGSRERVNGMLQRLSKTG